MWDSVSLFFMITFVGVLGMIFGMRAERRRQAVAEEHEHVEREDAAYRDLAQYWRIKYESLAEEWNALDDSAKQIVDFAGLNREGKNEREETS